MKKKSKAGVEKMLRLSIALSVYTYHSPERKLGGWFPLSSSSLSFSFLFFVFPKSRRFLHRNGQTVSFTLAICL